MHAPLAPAELERCAGFYRLSRLLHVAADIRIAPLLADGPRPCRELAAATQTDERTLRAVLDALCAWGAFERHADGYALNAFSERLVPGRDGAANVPLIAG